MFFINSSMGILLVILHLPFPVIKSFFPSIFIFSKMITSFPFFAEEIAANIPAGPPPITTTFIKTPYYIIFCTALSTPSFPYS